MMKRYIDAVVRYRYLIIVLSFIAVVIVASGAGKLKFSNDYRYFFSKENPELNAFENIQNTYSKNDNVLFALAPKNGKIFTRETLKVIEELTLSSWQIPYSSRVNSITNFQYTRAEEDDLIVEDLVSNAESLTDEELEEKKRIAVNEPFLMGRLITEKANVTGVNVIINLPGKSIYEVPEVADYSQNLADEIRKKYPDIEVYLTGIVIMNNTFSSAAQDDMKSLNPIMFAVIIGIMALLLRSFTATIATVFVIAMSAAAAMGLAGWFGIPITGVSILAPNIILTLAVADSIHILVTMFYEMRHGMSKIEALKESLRINIQPVFLTSITTMIGFLSMNFSDSPPYHDLGNIVAMGVVAAFLFSVLFLPAVMAVLPVRVKKRAAGSRRHAFDDVGDFVVRNRKKLFWGMLVVIIVFSAGISRIELNDKFTEYFDERYEFRRHTDYVTENLTGIYQVEYSLGAGGEGAVSEPEYLKKIDEFAAWYRTQPEVMHVNTFSDIMKRVNRSMHGDDDAYYRLPETRELAAQYLLLYEFSLPYGLDLNNQINVRKSATLVSVTLQSLSTKDLLALEAKAGVWLRANAPEHMFFKGASPAIMFGHIAKRNIIGMFQGTGIAIILISIILMVALRSFKVGLVSLVPNIAPALMAFGIWGVLISQVGMAVSVVAAMSLGIVVDDTVHFLSKFMRAKREHKLEDCEAVKYAFSSVGTALWVSSVTLIAGFLVLTYSGFTINSDMGLLTAVTIALALAADFLFLPPLLIMIGKEKRPCEKV